MTARVRGCPAGGVIVTGAGKDVLAGRQGPPAARPARGELGARAEALAARYVEERGYRVVARNFRCPAGEADLIARDGDEWVVVEVRARRGARLGTPEESLDRRKFARLVTVARWFLAQHGRPADPFRIDLVAVHWPGAAREPGAGPDLPAGGGVDDLPPPAIRLYQRLEGGAGR